MADASAAAEVSITAGLVTLALAGVLVTGSPLTVVSNLDASRYSGRWFEIARLPNRFQTKCAGDVTAEYQLRQGGGFVVVNRCRDNAGNTIDAEGVARAVDGQPPSILQVRFAPSFLSFLPFVWGDYQVIALDDGYTYSLVGTPDRKYLWILSRQRQMAPGQYDQLIELARAQGFAVERLEKTSHTGQ
jgi:apolipoprotein D and lipocalin family protein